MLREKRSFKPSAKFAARARLKPKELSALRRRAEADYTGFWADLARTHLRWHRPFTQVLDASSAPNYRWFSDGELNVSYNQQLSPIARGEEISQDISTLENPAIVAQLHGEESAGVSKPRSDKTIARGAATNKTVTEKAVTRKAAAKNSVSVRKTAKAKRSTRTRHRGSRSAR